MSWYYALGSQQVGPIGDEEFSQLVAAGQVTAMTLVWREGMANWQPYQQVYATANPVAAVYAMADAGAGGQVIQAGFNPPAAPADSAPTGFCSQCGRMFAAEDMINYQGVWVCAACKPLFFQRISEGSMPAAGVWPGAVQYGGFWLRFAARVIDGIALSVVNMLISMPVTLIGMASNRHPDDASFLLINVLSVVAQLGIQFGYETIMLGKYGATLGKMACGLKVIVSDGRKISYGRAAGRWLAYQLSALILMIGLIMAAFDDEKRALHDHICNTRVVRK